MIGHFSLIIVSLHILCSLAIASPLVEREPKPPKQIPFFSVPHLYIPYKKPLNRQVKAVLGIGDSFTAGVGSNGEPELIADKDGCSRYKSAWPKQLIDVLDWTPLNGVGQPRPSLTFGACSGHLMNDMLMDQLRQGAAETDVSKKFTAIGKPEIAVLTISGNDLDFASIVRSCFIGVQLSQSTCRGYLDAARKKLDSEDFKLQLRTTMQRIWLSGFGAGGATPYEAFEVYVAGYVPFFSTASTNCDDVKWTILASPLTLEIRKEMNGLVDDLNARIKEAVDAAYETGAGIFYVDGFQQAFDGHRFCEEGSTQKELKKPTGAKSWFWHTKNRNYDTDSEGAAGSFSSSSDEDVDVMQQLLDKYVPDKLQQAMLINSTNPGMISSVFASQDSLERALGLVDDSWRRLFHPKGSGYRKYAEAFLDHIIRHRTGADNIPLPPPISAQNDSSSPPPATKFAPGNCTMHVVESYTPKSPADEYAVDIVIHDAKGTEIGNSGGPRVMDAKTGYALTSALPWTMDAYTSTDKSAVVFSYADIGFTSDFDDGKHGKGPAWCRSGDWNPKNPGMLNEKPSKKRMDCTFWCH